MRNIPAQWVLHSLSEIQVFILSNMQKVTHFGAESLPWMKHGLIDAEMAVKQIASLVFPMSQEAQTGTGTTQGNADLGI